MADEENTGDDATELDEASGGGKLKLIIILVVILVLVGAGVGAYLMGMFGGGEEHPQETTENAAHAADEPAAGAEGEGATGAPGEAVAMGPFYYDLPVFIVNLNDTGTKTRILKANISLELENAEAVEKIKAFEPRIVDSFQVYLRELRTPDLKGSAGMYRLREELLLRLNKTIHPIKVNDILFKELFVQ